MATIANDNFMVCIDCTNVIANNDYSALSLYYADSGDLDQRIGEIVHGIANAGGIICAGSADNDEEFSRQPCDCCGSELAGPRVHFVVLGNNK